MHKGRAPLFLDWLFSYPIPAHTRQELTQQWCYATGADPTVTFALLNTRTYTPSNVR